MNVRLAPGLWMLCAIVAVAAAAQETPPEPLPGTKPLAGSGDFASELVDGVDRFLLRELNSSIEHRRKFWNRDFSSHDAYFRSIEANRKRLAHIVGVRDPRATDPTPRYHSTPEKSALVGRGEGYEIFAVSWSAFGDVNGEGLLLVPTDRPPVANIVAIPDCEVLPEQLVGLMAGVDPESQYARRLAESGCRVLVPMLINRKEKMSKLTNREWLYRSAFELGRGLIGYEVQKVLAAVDWFSQDSQTGIGIIGWGEGGLIGLYAAALDTRITAACVSGYFDSRQNIWQEPIDRNVFGLLEQFGDAELASLIAPRSLIVEVSKGPEVTIPGGRGAPARLVTPELEEVRREMARAKNLIANLEPSPVFELVETEAGKGSCGSEASLSKFLRLVSKESELSPPGKLPENLRGDFQPERRHQQQMHELDRHSQQLLRESQYVRQANTMSKFDFSSLDAFEKSAAKMRTLFYDEVIGKFDDSLLPPNVRSRRFKETEKWIGYEVVMDVFPDVMAYGLLLVPKNLGAGERRPVVVCQHGLEGRPQDTIGEQGSNYYSAFAGKLAERGFITFAPQNLYIFTDRFRTLQRKSNPLKKTLFSVITPQHQQIVDWLQSLDFVDSDRVAFYGLSYGGKTAMRVPALVTDYCLSICSADFNEWVDKNASTRNPRSYMNTGEYEIFEFDLGSTFNYAEMAALIAPRPFMVERGHFDGVADDWTVAFEYAKVRHLYAGRLKIPERTEIEWFDGPHKIHGKGTFDFLHRHLKWPAPEIQATGSRR